MKEAFLRPFVESRELGLGPFGGFTVGFRRPTSQADFDMLLKHRNDPTVRRWLGNDQEVSASQNAEFWASPAARFYRIATYGPDDSDVGLIRITVENHGALGRRACVGSDVFVHEQGRGLGHRVFERACDLAVVELGAQVLWLRVFLPNTRAVKIYLKAGFEFTGDVEMVSRYGSPLGPVGYATMQKLVRTA